jgi:uncharacterized cupredoxin-like copper-binding protein
MPAHWVAPFLVGVALVLGATSCGGTTAELTMYDNYFKPKGIVGDVGETVTVKLENEGKLKHNFSVPLLGLVQDVEPGKTVEVTVKIPPRNDAVFFCKYHGTRYGQGMAGGLTPAS